MFPFVPRVCVDADYMYLPELTLVSLPSSLKRYPTKVRARCTAQTYGLLKETARRGYEYAEKAWWKTRRPTSGLLRSRIPTLVAIHPPTWRCTEWFRSTHACEIYSLTEERRARSCALLKAFQTVLH